MTDPHDWQDTQQLDPAEARPVASGSQPAATQAPLPEQNATDFANTELLEGTERDSTVWAEAADGRCSEDAALFAASQPAPLSIV